MNELEDAIADAISALEDLANDPIDWPGLQYKLKLMRDKIGNCQVQYVYTPFGTVSHTNPSDSAIENMGAGDASDFANWVVGLGQ